MNICRQAVRSIFLLAALPPATLLADTPPNANQTHSAQTDLFAAQAALPKDSLHDRVDPKRRDEMAKKWTAPLRHIVGLAAEMEKNRPASGRVIRDEHSLYLALLCVYGDADALKTLTDASKSTVPANAIFGKTGLLRYQWWKDPNADTQKQVLADYQKLAKANPKEDFLVDPAWEMSNNFAATDELATAMRDIVLKDLHGPMAVSFQRHAASTNPPKPAPPPPTTKPSSSP